MNKSDHALQPQTAAQAGGSGSLLRSSRGMRLGLGAVTRNASGSAKGKAPGQGQKPVVFSQPIQPVSAAANQKSQDDAGMKIRKKTLVPFIPEGGGILCVWFLFSNLKHGHLISLSAVMGQTPPSFKLA